MNTDIRNLTKWLNEGQEAPIDRQALARVLVMAEQQEPIGKWMGNAVEWTENPYKFRKGQLIYTSPPAQRKPLTDGVNAKLLAALQNILECDDEDHIPGDLVAEAKEAIESAQQPAQQAPVECQYGKCGYACCEGGPCKADEQNNAAQRTWVGLSEEDREQHRNDWHSNIHDKEFRAIEAKLKENT